MVCGVQCEDGSDKHWRIAYEREDGENLDDAVLRGSEKRIICFPEFGCDGAKRGDERGCVRAFRLDTDRVLVKPGAEEGRGTKDREKISEGLLMPSECSLEAQEYASALGDLADSGALLMGEYVTLDTFELAAGLLDLVADGLIEAMHDAGEDLVGLYLLRGAEHIFCLEYPMKIIERVYDLIPSGNEEALADDEVDFLRAGAVLAAGYGEMEHEIGISGERYREGVGRRGSDFCLDSLIDTELLHDLAYFVCARRLQVYPGDCAASMSSDHRSFSIAWAFRGSFVTWA